MTRAPEPNRNTPADNPAARLERLTRRAALTLFWERVWPPLATGGAVVALFLAASWAGLWLQLPALAREIALAAFGLALIVALAPLAATRWPTRAMALGRLDRDAPKPHRPASGFEDKLANDGGDEETRALWALHQARLAEEVAALKLQPPSPRMAARDPRALRFAALLIALAAFLAAGPQRTLRVLAAFQGGPPTAGAAEARVDAWIDPPAYANKPPLLLKVAGQRTPEPITTPEDSTLVLRAESNEYDARVEGALAPAEAGEKPQAAGTSVERRFVVHGDGVFSVLRSGAPIATFRISAIALGRPAIALIDPPKANLSGSLALHYRISDPYGVASAGAAFDAVGDEKAAPKHRLVEPPKFALSLPSGPGGVGEARTTGDLSEHPWAGAEVSMTLSAVDVAGRVGESEPLKLTLPQRPFNNPLAKALVEERRNLILDPDGSRGKLAVVLDALRVAPDVFGTSASVYLGLGVAKTRLIAARDDKALLGVADLLWAMALQIEDGDASQALRDLRAAEQKLREALKRGASDEEIRELTKELREMAERYMRELAEQAPKTSPEEAPLDAKDLDSMLDRLEQNAENGARDEAQAMLDELQDMFENMRSARNGEESAGQKEMRREMGELDKLLRDQQALRDETFRRDQRERQRRAHPDAAPESGDEGDSADSQSLQDRQQALRERLEELKRRMKGLGLKGEQGFDDAQGDMQEAERDLQGEGQGQQGQGDEGAQPGRGRSAKGDAVEAQGRALEALRRGAQGLQQQMQANGNGPGRGGYRAVGRSPGEGQQGRDPLGRDLNGERGASEGRLYEGQDTAERARRVLEELRRRLANPNRPGDERDYLERLLKSE